MKLHRTASKPDWELVEVGSYNSWQKIAAGSRGWLTPGNVFTAGGFGLVLVGLMMIAHEHYWLGLIVVAVGRLCDLLDGWLADKTGTKSPLGEVLDATFDKFGVLAALIVLPAAGVLSIWATLLIFIPHLAISIVNYLALRRRVRLHPSRVGKVSMAVAWVSLLGFVCAQALDSSLLTMISSVLVIISALLANYAALQYARQTFPKT